MIFRDTCKCASHYGSVTIVVHVIIQEKVCVTVDPNYGQHTNALERAARGVARSWTPPAWTGQTVPSGQTGRHRQER